MKCVIAPEDCGLANGTVTLPAPAAGLAAGVACGRGRCARALGLLYY